MIGYENPIDSHHYHILTRKISHLILVTGVTHGPSYLDRLSAISLIECTLKKIIFSLIQSTTLKCITLRSFIRHLQSQHPVSTFGIEKVFGSMKTLPVFQKKLVSPADFSTRPVGQALWGEPLILSKIHS